MASMSANGAVLSDEALKGMSQEERVEALGSRRGLRADLHPGVQVGVVHLHLELEFEIAVVLLRRKEGRLLGPRADDGTALHLEVRVAAGFDPAVQRLSVEQGHPVVSLHCPGCGRHEERGHEGGVDDGSHLAL